MDRVTPNRKKVVISSVFWDCGQNEKKENKFKTKCRITFFSVETNIFVAGFDSTTDPSKWRKLSITHTIHDWRLFELCTQFVSSAGAILSILRLKLDNHCLQDTTTAYMTTTPFTPFSPSPALRISPGHLRLFLLILLIWTIPLPEPLVCDKNVVYTFIIQ